MVHESPGQPPVPVTLPPSLDEWLAERADEAGIDRGELLVQLAATYRAAAEDDAAAGGLVNAVEEAATDAATERVDDRLGSFRSSLDSQLQVIRKRVVQLKRESDEKAEASRLRELSTRVDDLESLDERLGELEDAVGTLRERVDERPVGGGGAESSPPWDADAAPDAAPGGRGGTAVDPGLLDRLDDVESKLVRVAHAVVELRDGSPEGAAGDGTLRELKRVAAREGVREARCAGCDGTVDLALLPGAVCPHCDTPVRDLAVGGTDDEAGGDGARLEVARVEGSADGVDGDTTGSIEVALDGDGDTDVREEDR